MEKPPWGGRETERQDEQVLGTRSIVSLDLTYETQYQKYNSEEFQDGNPRKLNTKSLMLLRAGSWLHIYETSPENMQAPTAMVLSTNTTQ